MQITNFYQLSKEELVTFIADNFVLLDSERAPGFPRNIHFNLESDSFQFFRNPNGFADVSTINSPPHFSLTAYSRSEKLFFMINGMQGA
jgi:hypothetical protein